MKKEFRPRLNNKINNAVSAMKGNREIKSYIVTGCNHVPFNNKNLTNGLLDLMGTYSYNGIIIAGDFLDMGALGKYEKGKVSNSGVSLKDEYESGNELLDSIDYLLPHDALKVYIWGNHEDRYFRWISDVNNNKLGTVLNPTDELNLIERGYKVLDNYKSDFFKLGSLFIMHGEYYNIHAAKKHLDVFRRNTLFFHTHRIQLYREGEFCSWNCGTMADINSICFNYAPRGMKSQWANGFAIVHIDDNNNHFVEQINCVNDSFVYNGVKYGN